jgi:hypothetical protein
VKKWRCGKPVQTLWALLHSFDYFSLAARPTFVDNLGLASQPQGVLSRGDAPEVV